MPYPNDRERCACRCGESIEGRADVTEDGYIIGHRLCGLCGDYVDGYGQYHQECIDKTIALSEQTT